MDGEISWVSGVKPGVVLLQEWMVLVLQTSEVCQESQVTASRVTLPRHPVVVIISTLSLLPRFPIRSRRSLRLAMSSSWRRTRTDMPTEAPPATPVATLPVRSSGQLSTARFEISNSPFVQLRVASYLEARLVRQKETSTSRLIVGGLGAVLKELLLCGQDASVSSRSGTWLEIAFEP